MKDKRQATTQGKAVTRRHFMVSAASAAVAAGAGPATTKAAASPLRANSRIGIGIIGTGTRANNLMKSLTWLKSEGMNIEITAVCDVYRPRLERAAIAHKAKGYTDHRELLADSSVDAVIIASPDHHHGQQAIDAIRARKDVYCEKPITHWRQFELAKQLTEEALRSGQVFQVGTQGMSDSAWRQMKDFVKAGMIGKPIHVECGYFRIGDWGERGMPIDDPNAKPGADLNWNAFLGDAPKRPFDVSRFFRWRMYEDYAGGPVTDLYPHSLAPVISILELKAPDLVVATGGKFRYEKREVPDTFNILVDYPNNLTVVVMGTQGNTFCNPDPKRRGAEAKVPVIRGWEGTLTVRGKEIVYIPIADEPGRKEESFPIEQDQDLTDHIQNFLDCCMARNRQTFSPPDLAYYTQLPLIMAMLAYKNGKTARFDHTSQRIVL
jgi:predicted dehydrogenase